MILLSKVVLLSFITLTIVLLIFCCYLSEKVTHPKIHKYDETYQWEKEHGRIPENELNSIEKEEVFIDSPYGYKVHGLFYINKNSKKAVILCHGITWSLYGCLKYVQMFFNKGFSVLVYDHRNHGLSGGKDTSFGYFEKYDLKACTDWLMNKLGKDAIVGLLGESMGAGTVLQNVPIDSRIKFCIADCSYSDITALFKYHLAKDYKIKVLPLVEITSIITKLRNGWSFKDISPISSISNCDTPILFIHGADDDFVPTWMSEEMHKAKKGCKDIYIAPNAAHIETYWKDAQEYEKRVDHFLEENGIMTKDSLS
jgi:fermentation-respiration switch protein FrsA (DUF1100 family)